MVLMIDTYDSFTYNLVRYCGELGHTVQVARNDAIDGGSQLDAPDLEPGKITGMGLMIYDNQDGVFELSLESVRALAIVQDS